MTSTGRNTQDPAEEPASVIAARQLAAEAPARRRAVPGATWAERRAAHRDTRDTPTTHPAP